MEIKFSVIQHKWYTFLSFNLNGKKTDGGNTFDAHLVHYLHLHWRGTNTSAVKYETTTSDESETIFMWHAIQKRLFC